MEVLGVIPGGKPIPIHHHLSSDYMQADKTAQFSYRRKLPLNEQTGKSL
jgi:hypothetical protein